MTGTANQLPKLVIRPNGPQNLRKRFGVTFDRELAEQLGLSRAQVSRVLSGKNDAGNQFIAGIIYHCGHDFALTQFFEVNS
jgi:transcriptional regulator with XRE-family HTH domain